MVISAIIMPAKIGTAMGAIRSEPRPVEVGPEAAFKGTTDPWY
jgi:hypothetical protein